MRTSNRLSILALASLMVAGAVLMGAVPAETGQLKVLRTSPSGEMGQGIEITLTGPVSQKHKIVNTPKKIFTVPVGWYQVNCSPIKGKGAARGSSIEIKRDSETMVRCFFPKAAPEPVVAEKEDEEEGRPSPSVIEALSAMDSAAPPPTKGKMVSVQGRSGRVRSGMGHGAGRIAVGKSSKSMRRRPRPTRPPGVMAAEPARPEHNTYNIAPPGTRYRSGERGSTNACHALRQQLVSLQDQQYMHLLRYSRKARPV